MTTKEHLENTLRLWNFIMEEAKGLQIFLSDDKKINEQFYRRIFIRNIFSTIETFLYLGRELIKIKLIVDDNQDNISWSTLAILYEKKVVLDDKGNVRELDDFQKFEPYLRFTLNLFATTFKSQLPNYGDANFEKLKQLSRRRNDVTHPKSLAQLTISNYEMNDTISMFSWFQQTFNIINENVMEWLHLNYGKGKLQ